MKKLDWIEEWHQSSHAPLPTPSRIPAPPRFDLIKQGISTLPPPDFLKATDSSIVRPFLSPSPDFYNPSGHELPPPPSHNKPSSPTLSPPKKAIHPNYQRNWFNEEISFAMNKLSIFGLVFGLMLLGTLLFIGGFLTAYTFYARPNTPHDYDPWSAAQHNHSYGAVQGTYPYHSGHNTESHPHNYAAGVVGYALHRQASRLNSAVHIPHIGGGGFLAPATNRLNSSLQTKTHQGINAGSQQIMAPLNPKFYNRPEQNPSYAKPPYEGHGRSGFSSTHTSQQNHHGQNYRENHLYSPQNSYNKPYIPPYPVQIRNNQRHSPYSNQAHYEQPYHGNSPHIPRTREQNFHEIVNP